MNGKNRMTGGKGRRANAAGKSSAKRSMDRRGRAASESESQTRSRPKRGRGRAASRRVRL
jgi:hypothetical protein